MKLKRVLCVMMTLAILMMLPVFTQAAMLHYPVYAVSIFSSAVITGCILFIFSLASLLKSLLKS